MLFSGASVVTIAASGVSAIVWSLPRGAIMIQKPVRATFAVTLFSMVMALGGLQREAEAASLPHPFPAPRMLRVGWVYDRPHHAAANQAGRNCWGIYLSEILDELGLESETIAPTVLKSADRLSRYTTVLFDCSLVSNLRAPEQEALAKWVEDGGTLIAFAAEGLDELAGNRSAGRLPQPEGEFSCAATFALQPHPVTRDIHSRLQPAQRLLVFSEARLVR